MTIGPYKAGDLIAKIEAHQKASVDVHQLFRLLRRARRHGVQHFYSSRKTVGDGCLAVFSKRIINVNGGEFWQRIAPVAGEWGIERSDPHHMIALIRRGHAQSMKGARSAIASGKYDTARLWLKDAATYRLAAGGGLT